MKSSSPALAGYKLAAATFWAERSAQERKLLKAGAWVAALALVYAVLLAPALDGRAKLEKELPLLRQDAADLQALARQADEVKRQTPLQVPAMSRDSLAASLTTRGLSAQSLALTGEYAKLQLNGVAFAALAAWLDALRRENRIVVREASVTAQTKEGMVDATLTLYQSADASR